MGRAQFKSARWRALATSLVLGALAVPASLWANEVFVSRGEFGEPSFSDVASPGASSLQVDTPAASDVARLSAQAQTQETLAVAEALESARLTRQRERAARQREAQRPVVTPVIYHRPPEHVPVYWPAYTHGRGFRRPHAGHQPPSLNSAPSAPSQPRFTQRWLAPRQP